MDPDRQSQIYNISQRMVELSQEIVRICGEEPDSNRAAALLKAQQMAQRHIDSISGISSNEPLSDLVVEVTMPSDDETIHLRADWDSEEEEHRIMTVPIELAPIVREINAGLRNLKSSGTAEFRWQATPEYSVKKTV